MRRGRKLGTAVAVVVSITALAGVLALAGCAASSKSSTSSDGSASGEATSIEHATTEAASFDEWIEQYPEVYATFAQIFFADDYAYFSHYSQYDKDVRYEQYWDGDVTGTCISCKTADFADLYEQYGDAAYGMTLEELGYDGSTYFNCTTCHTDSVSLDLQASLVSFQMLAGSLVDGIDQKVLVCGQCHNAIGQYGYTLGDDFSAEEADPYRYGTDAASLYKAYVEDGQGSVDEATGAYLVAPSYSDFELFINGNHYLLGVTCVDCHMTETTDEDGTTFRSHYSSSSPLENETALEYCLTCHEAQGIESTDAMVEFFKEKEDAFAETYTAASDALASLGEALTEATAAGTTDDAIDQARDKYAEANFYLAFATSYNHDAGYRMAHNADGMSDTVSAAQQLIDEGLELMS